MDLTSLDPSVLSYVAFAPQRVFPRAGRIRKKQAEFRLFPGLADRRFHGAASGVPPTGRQFGPAAVAHFPCRWPLSSRPLRGSWSGFAKLRTTGCAEKGLANKLRVFLCGTPASELFQIDVPI
jgi:hypothetical protein